MKNRVIVNAAIGSEHSWYHRGQNLLKETLATQGAYLESEIHFVQKYEPTLGSAYEDKILTIYEAISLGYSRVLWLDCSITAINRLDFIWTWIDMHGYYLYSSGYNCAQTCNDRSLDFYGITRDQAEKMPECASNVVGFNLDHHSGKKLFEIWHQSLTGMANRGVKWPNEIQRKSESADPRFLFHRQDQSTLSLAAGILNLPMDQPENFVRRSESTAPLKDSVVFILKGGVGE